MKIVQLCLLSRKSQTSVFSVVGLSVPKTNLTPFKFSNLWKFNPLFGKILKCVRKMKVKKLESEDKKGEEKNSLGIFGKDGTKDYIYKSIFTNNTG